MVRLFVNKYNVLGRELEAWKKKKKKEYKNYMEYNKSKLMILNFILGRLNKGGHKARSFVILTNLLWYLKKEKKMWVVDILKKKKWSLIEVLKWLIFQTRQVVLLYNKKKGSLVYELPRFLTIEQSLKRIVNWIIKIAIKNKKNIENSLITELENIYLKKGEIWKKKKYIRDIAMKNRPFFYLLRKKKKKRKIK